MFLDHTLATTMPAVISSKAVLKSGLNHFSARDEQLLREIFTHFA
jgi:hypothetical protein